MIRYAPANVPMRPLALAQVTPTLPPKPPAGLPSLVVNLAIMAGGLGIGLLGFHNRKHPLGAITTSMGGSVAGIGFIFTVLDLLGFRAQQL